MKKPDSDKNKRLLVKFGPWLKGQVFKGVICNIQLILLQIAELAEAL